MYDTAIKELNAFLKGQYMGIHAYENLIQSTDDFYLKKELQNIQKDHKIHAMRIAERIQNLGGIPATDEGLRGSLQNFVGRITAPRSVDEILRKALKGEEYYGIHISHEIVKGDLDPQSMQLVDEILHHDEKHVDTIKDLLH